MLRICALIVVIVSLASSVLTIRSSSSSVVGTADEQMTEAVHREMGQLQRISTLDESVIPAVDGPRISNRFPNIDLIDHHGRNLKFYDDLVKDRSVCIVFFYTRCVGSCPGTTVTLKHLREALKNEFTNDEFKFISLTLEPDVDSPEELREYMDRYRIKDDPDLPDWVYATGDFEELDALRRSLGVYDLDPIIDADKTEHAAIITFGNDRTDRWAALPTGMKNSYLADTITRIAGNSDRQRYTTALFSTIAKVDEPEFCNESKPCCVVPVGTGNQN